MRPDSFQQLDCIREISTLPAVVLKVNQMLQDPHTTAEQLCRVIETDPALVIKILRLANSSFYGFKSTISNISNAVIILGFNTIQHAVISISLMQLLTPKTVLKELNIQDFWQHSLTVAIVSRHLADQVDNTLSSDCFTAGLLHDIGKLILAGYFPEHFDAVTQMMLEFDLSFITAEKKIGALNHAVIGAYLADEWLLPKPLVDAIWHHHDIFTGDHQTAAIINTSDIMANTLQPDAAGRMVDPNGFSNIPDFLQPHLLTLSVWYPRLQAEIASACKIFIEGNLLNDE
jgi:putative nucleotidyltransferase with HDIG domain